jgi:GGDEF domain-containing protein
MKRIRWRVVSLLLWLTLFFNIERLDLNVGEIAALNLNLPTSVYVVGAAAALLALTPTLQRRPVGVLIGGAVVCYIAALLLSGEPVLRGNYMYLTFTGILMLAITVVLAHQLGASLSEFLAAVEEMTFSSKGGQMPVGAEAQELVQREMAISRRSQRPLSLLLLQTEPASLDMMMHRLIQDIQRTMLQRYLLSTVARVLTRYVRRTDLVVEGPEPGQLVLLAPETAPTQAEILGERLSQMTRERLGVATSFSIVTFPEHALTYEALLGLAQQRLREQRPALARTIEPEEQITRLAEQQAHEQLSAPAAPQPGGQR